MKFALILFLAALLQAPNDKHLVLVESFSVPTIQTTKRSQKKCYGGVTKRMPLLLKSSSRLLTTTKLFESNHNSELPSTPAVTTEELLVTGDTNLKELSEYVNDDNNMIMSADEIMHSVDRVVDAPSTNTVVETTAELSAMDDDSTFLKELSTYYLDDDSMSDDEFIHAFDLSSSTETITELSLAGDSTNLKELAAFDGDDNLSAGDFVQSVDLPTSQFAATADNTFLKELTAFADDDKMSADEFMLSVDEFIQETLPPNNAVCNEVVGAGSIDEFIQETIPSTNAAANVVNYNNGGIGGSIDEFIQATLSSNGNENVDYSSGGIGGGGAYNGGLTTTQFIESTFPVISNLPHDDDARQILDLHFVDMQSTIHKMLDNGITSDFAAKYSDAIVDPTNEMLQQTMMGMTGEEQATFVATAAVGAAAAAPSVATMIDKSVPETASTKSTAPQEVPQSAVAAVDPQQSNPLTAEVVGSNEQTAAVVQQASQPTDTGTNEMMTIQLETVADQHSQHLNNLADSVTPDMMVQDQVVQQQQYVDTLIENAAASAVTDMSNVIASSAATNEVSDAAAISSVASVSSAAEMVTTAAATGNFDSGEQSLSATIQSMVPGTVDVDSIEQSISTTIQSIVPGSINEVGEIIIKGLQFIANILYQALDTVIDTISGGDSMARHVAAARASIDSVVSDAISSIQSTSAQISQTTVGDICEGLVSLVIMPVKFLFQIMSWIVLQLSGKGIPDWVTEATTAMHDASQNLIHEVLAFGHDVGSTTFADIGEMVGYFLSEVARFIVEVFDSLLEFGGAVSTGGILENALADNSAIEGITSVVTAAANHF